MAIRGLRGSECGTVFKTRRILLAAAQGHPKRGCDGWGRRPPRSRLAAYAMRRRSCKLARLRRLVVRLPAGSSSAQQLSRSLLRYGPVGRLRKCSQVDSENSTKGELRYR